MRQEAESTLPGPQHEARKALWKKALKRGSITRGEMEQAVADQQELALLALSLQLAEVRLTESPEAAEALTTGPGP